MKNNKKRNTTKGGLEKIPLKILYIHGMEAGPEGYKPTHLKKYYTEVNVPFMDINRYKSPRANPWAAMLYIVGFTIVPIAFSLLLETYNGIISGQLFSSGLMKSPISRLALHLAQGGFLGYMFYRRAASYVVERCLDVQTNVLEEFDPDVVVGSSFGGALALILLGRNKYRLPTVLLAPAQTRVWNATGIKSLTRNDIQETKCGIFVVQGLHDTVIPVNHTKDLYQGLKNTIVQYVPDEHGLPTIVENDYKDKNSPYPMIVKYIEDVIRKHADVVSETKL